MVEGAGQGVALGRTGPADLPGHRLQDFGLRLGMAAGGIHGLDHLALIISERYARAAQRGEAVGRVLQRLAQLGGGTHDVTAEHRRHVLRQANRVGEDRARDRFERGQRRARRLHLVALGKGGRLQLIRQISHFFGRDTGSVTGGAQDALEPLDAQLVGRKLPQAQRDTGRECANTCSRRQPRRAKGAEHRGQRPGPLRQSLDGAPRLAQAGLQCLEARRLLARGRVDFVERLFAIGSEALKLGPHQGGILEAEADGDAACFTCHGCLLPVLKNLFQPLGQRTAGPGRHGAKVEPSARLNRAQQNKHHHTDFCPPRPAGGGSAKAHL